ncbi:4'-phosphopantetheinyl transferase superfamily protein [Streptomyces sp. NPDC051771]|uniref:4'-phosphopantetheinyl transferase family protein n=1 Tax=Streptomyces sp. NPDC051771 TaxID=3154847 RepID=UPI00343B8BC7
MLPAPGECHLWLTPTRPPRDWPRLLAPEEAARASALPPGPRRDTYTTSRASQRLLAGHYMGTPPPQVRIDRTCHHCGADHGRPRWLTATPLDYSVAHTAHWILIAVVTRGLVGVDMEELPTTPPSPRLAAKSLTAPERDLLAATPPPDRPAAFTRLWTRKEAATKLTGHGLATAFASLDTTTPLLTHPRFPTPLHLQDLPLPAPHHLSSLATTHPTTPTPPRRLTSLTTRTGA